MVLISRRSMGCGAAGTEDIETLEPMDRQPETLYRLFVVGSPRAIAALPLRPCARLSADGIDIIIDAFIVVDRGLGSIRGRVGASFWTASSLGRFPHRFADAAIYIVMAVILLSSPASGAESE